MPVLVHAFGIPNSLGDMGLVHRLDQPTKSEGTSNRSAALGLRQDEFRRQFGPDYTAQQSAGGRATSCVLTRRARTKFNTRGAKG